MLVASKQLANALISSLEEGAEVEPLIKNFKAFVTKNRLTALVPNVIKNLERMSVEVDRKNTALIRVSHETKDATIKLIEKFIDKQKSDQSKVEVDESLIGGFRVNYRGRVFDGSVKNYLKELRANLMK